MLILTRQPGEAIRLNDDILITVVRVSRNRVRIGVEAPREVVIRREPSLARQAQNNSSRYTRSAG